MGLEYKIPQVGEYFSEEDLKKLADSNGYEFRRLGNNQQGEDLITLSDSNTPVGMSFLLVDNKSVEPYKRVY
jgi:hypothetical protein